MNSKGPKSSWSFTSARTSIRTRGYTIPFSAGSSGYRRDNDTIPLMVP